VSFVVVLKYTDLCSWLGALFAKDPLSQIHAEWQQYSSSLKTEELALMWHNTANTDVCHWA
jgi:hypothetical protein